MNRSPFLVLVALTFAATSMIGCAGDSDSDDGSDDGHVTVDGHGTTNGPPDETNPPCGASCDDTDDVAPPGALPTFVDVADQWGVTFTRYDDQRGQHRILEANGGGAGLFDFDLDGNVDLFLTNGCRLPRIEAGTDHPSVLLRGASGDDADGVRFVDVTVRSELLEYGYSQGCAVGDVNEDGFPDLLVTAFGANSLWVNNGDGTFDRLDLPGPNDAWSSSAAIADLDGDGLLDLYVVNYVLTGDDPPRLCPNDGHPDGFMQCPPTVFDAAPDTLLVNDGRGGFVDRTAEYGVTATDGKGLGVVVFDVERDGALDVYVANDGMPNHLYRNQRLAPGEPAETMFVEGARRVGVSLNRRGDAEASMGVACGDVDRNGWPDLFLTHFFGESNTLYLNDGGQLFDDVSARSRLGAPSLRYLAFGTEFLDWDNDGWLDVVVGNGHVDDFEAVDAAEPYAMRPQAFRNERDRRFLEVTRWAGLAFEEPHIARGLAKGDLDRDGRVDVVVSRQRTAAGVLRNVTEDAHPFASFRFVGAGAAPRSAIGVRLVAEFADGTSYHELIGGGSFQSASEQRLHVGFGDNDVIPRLRVEWPNGEGTDEFENVTPGRYVLDRTHGLLPEAG